MRVGRVETKEGIFYAEFSDDTARLLEKEPFEEIARTGKSVPLSECRLLAPSTPRDIIAVGLNYRKHAEEIDMGLKQEPLLFSKLLSSVLKPGETIVKPKMSQRLDYEAELAFVIGKKCRNIKKEDAADYIFGYTCLNDVTARDLQETGGQWERCKGFDTFCPFGPWVETELDPSAVRVRAVLNGKTVQDGNTKDFIFDVPTLLEYISAFKTLYPGDVITTGTPGGIGPMQPGDEIKIVVDGVGELVNAIGAEA